MTVKENRSSDYQSILLLGLPPDPLNAVGSTESCRIH